MDNVRSGNMLVINMKKEINKSLALLELGYINKRVQRQLVDGNKFLEMLEKDPYKSCRKVSDLKDKIKEERKKLKERLSQTDKFMPGHQFSFFETVQEISKQEQIELNNEKARLLNEIRWLHKCLGMCTSRDYFK